MIFHERLRELRQKSEFMQKEVAEKLGVSVITLRQYEQGSREPNIKRLLQLAVIFDVSLDYLLCLNDFKKAHEASSDES